MTSEPVGDLDRDRRADDGGGGVVEDVRQRHDHGHQHGEDHPGRQAGGEVDQTPGDEAGAARLLQRDAERDHRAEQHDDRPFDLVVDLAKRHDSSGDVDYDHSGERDGERHQAEACHRHGKSEDADGECGPSVLGDAEAAVGQRQGAEPLRRLVEAVRRAEQEQHVAGADSELPDTVAKPGALARNPEDGDAGIAVNADIARCPAVKPRVTGHHHLEECEVGAAVIGDPGPAGKVEPESADQRIDALDRAVDDENVARLDGLAAGAAGQAAAAADEAEDSDARLDRVVVEVGDRLAQSFRILANREFGDIAMDGAKRLGGGLLAVAGRDETPADGGDEDDADDGTDKTDGSEIEHTEIATQRLAAIGGDDDVGRRADQRHHAAEDGGEGERHQGRGRAPPGLGGGAELDRHQQGKGGDVVHERREPTADRRHDRNMPAEAAGLVDGDPRDPVDGAGIDQPARDDQDNRDDDGGGMTEAGEDGVAGDDAGKGGNDQCGEGNEIVAKAAPDHQAEHGDEQDEEEGLVEGHLVPGRREGERPPA